MKFLLIGLLSFNVYAEVEFNFNDSVVIKNCEDQECEFYKMNSLSGRIVGINQKNVCNNYNTYTVNFDDAPRLVYICSNNLKRVE